MKQKTITHKQQAPQNTDGLKQALFKKAIGYVTEEIIEEYNIDEDDRLRLVKKKVTQKEVAPDIPAARALLELDGANDLTILTDEQLEEEKQRLLRLLEKGGKDES